MTSMTTTFTLRGNGVDTANRQLAPRSSGTWAYLLAVTGPVQLPNLRDV